MKILGLNIERSNHAVKNLPLGDLDEFLRWKMNVERGAAGFGKDDAYALYRAVPWLGRGVQLIAQAIHDFPFEIRNENGDMLDESHDWKNVLGFTGINFSHLLWKLSSALTLRGRAYLFPARNRLIIKDLKYFNPDSIRPKITPEDGLIEFKRRFGANEITLSVEDLIYFWLPDPQVEIGPPLAYPAQLAMNASGILFSLDQFFKQHTEGGLIRAYLAAVKGQPHFDSPAGKAAKEKLDDQFDRLLTGVANAGRVRAINADTVTIVPIGEGLKELQDVELTQEKRADIGTALGVPASILWSGESRGLGGGGVTKEDTFRFYTQKIMPDFDFISDVLNEQLFSRLDPPLRMIGLPETLGVMQEDEKDRSTAFANYVSAGIDKRVVASILNLSIPEDVEDIWKETTAPASSSNEVAQAIDITPKPQQLAPGETPEQKQFRENVMRWATSVETRLNRKALPEPVDDKMVEELQRWQRKVNNRLNAGKSILEDFVSKYLTPEIKKYILDSFKCLQRDFQRIVFLVTPEGAAPEAEAQLVQTARHVTQILDGCLPTKMFITRTPQECEPILLRYDPADTFVFDWTETSEAANIIDRLHFAHTGSSEFTIDLVLDRIKQFIRLRSNNIPVPSFMELNTREALADWKTYPALIRPNEAQGSEDMHEVNSLEEARKWFDDIVQKHPLPTLIMQKVGDREFSVGLWSDGRSIEAFPVAEANFARSPDDVKGEDDKDTTGPSATQQNICPAQIPGDLQMKLVETARKCFMLFGIRTYARIDFRYDGAVYVIDVNSEPEISEDSLMCVMAKAAGLSYDQLILGIVRRGMTYWHTEDARDSVDQVKSIFERAMNEEAQVGDAGEVKAARPHDHAKRLTHEKRIEAVMASYFKGQLTRIREEM